MPGDSQRRFPSPLRYPGGKGKIANYLKLLFLQNGLVGHDYVELYAGGASVALSLLYEEYASHITINDLNSSVHAFWDATLNQTEALCRRISSTRISMAEWHRQHAVQSSAAPDPLDLAFSTFYLNRTNRSGIIDGGVIGGQHQTGEWKLDARFNKPDLIRRIEKVARYRSRITLTRHDAADYLRDQTLKLRPETLLYLDPPYYVKGEGLYQNFYGHSDHAEVAELVCKLEVPWIVSYDAVPQVLRLYDGCESIVYGLSYSASERYRGREVMFFSSALEPPDIPSPAGIRVPVIDRARREMLEAS